MVNKRNSTIQYLSKAVISGMRYIYFIFCSCKRRYLVGHYETYELDNLFRKYTESSCPVNQLI
jgi:hypothetical protein